MVICIVCCSVALCFGISACTGADGADGEDCGSFWYEDVAATNEHTYTYTVSETGVPVYDAADNTVIVSYTYTVTIGCSVCSKYEDSVSVTISASDYSTSNVGGVEAGCTTDGKKTATLTVAETGTIDGTEVTYTYSYTTTVSLTVEATGHAITVYTLTEGAVTDTTLVYIPEEGAAIFVDDNYVDKNDVTYYIAYIVEGVDDETIIANAADSNNWNIIYQYTVAEYTALVALGYDPLIEITDNNSKTNSCEDYTSAVFLCANNSTHTDGKKYVTIYNARTPHNYVAGGYVDATNKLIYTTDSTLAGTTTPVVEEGQSEATTYTYVYYVIAPTCTEDGYSVYTCSICGTMFELYATPAKGHTYVQGDAEATVNTEAGTITVTVTCSDCGTETDPTEYILTLTIPTEGWSNESDYQLDSETGAVYTTATVTDENEYEWVRTTVIADCTHKASVTYTITGITVEALDGETVLYTSTVGTITAVSEGAVAKNVHVYVYVGTTTEIYILYDSDYKDESGSGVIYTVDTEGNVYAPGSSTAITGLTVTAVDNQTTASCNSESGIHGNTNAYCHSEEDPSDYIAVLFKTEHTWVNWTKDYDSYDEADTTHAYAEATCTTDEVLYRYCTTCQSFEQIKDTNVKAYGHTYEVKTTTDGEGKTTESISYAEGESDYTGTFTVVFVCSDCGEMEEDSVEISETDILEAISAEGNVYNKQDITVATCIAEEIVTYTYVYSYTSESVTKTITLTLTYGGNPIENGTHTYNKDVYGNEIVTTYAYTAEGVYYKVYANVCTVCGYINVLEESIEQAEEITIEETLSGEEGTGEYTATVNLVAPFDVYSGLTSVTGEVTINAAGYYAVTFTGDVTYAYLLIMDDEGNVVYNSNTDSYILDLDNVYYEYYDLALEVSENTTYTIYVAYYGADDSEAEVVITITLDKDYEEPDILDYVDYTLTSDVFNEELAEDGDGSIWTAAEYSVYVAEDGVYTIYVISGDVSVQYNDEYGSTTEAISGSLTLELSAGDIIVLEVYEDSTVIIVEGDVITEGVEATATVEEDNELGYVTFVFVVTEDGYYTLTYSDNVTKLVASSEADYGESAYFTTDWIGWSDNYQSGGYFVTYNTSDDAPVEVAAGTVIYVYAYADTLEEVTLTIALDEDYESTSGGTTTALELSSEGLTIEFDGETYLYNEDWGTDFVYTITVTEAGTYEFKSDSTNGFTIYCGNWYAGYVDYWNGDYETDSHTFAVGDEITVIANDACTLWIYVAE